MRDGDIKQLIQNGHMTDYEIKPVVKKILIMKIYFDNHRPIFIRKGKWEEYWDILDEAEKQVLKV